MGAFSGRLEIDDETVDEARLNGSALKTSDDAKRARLLPAAAQPSKQWLSQQQSTQQQPSPASTSLIQQAAREIPKLASFGISSPTQ